MTYYPDCGHDQCNCPSYPGVAEAQRARVKVNELRIKNDRLRAQLINANEFSGGVVGLKRKISTLEVAAVAHRNIISQLNFIISDLESDSKTKLKLIELTIKGELSNGT